MPRKFESGDWVRNPRRQIGKVVSYNCESRRYKILVWYAGDVGDPLAPKMYRKTQEWRSYQLEKAFPR